MVVSANFGLKIPVIDDVLSYQEQENYPNTSVDANIIEFEFQTDRNFYVDLKKLCWVLKLKFVKNRGYETYNSEEVEKRHE